MTIRTDFLSSLHYNIVFGSGVHIFTDRVAELTATRLYTRFVFRFLLILFFLFLLSGIATWFLLGKPWFMPASFAARQLQSILPRLEQDHIEAYRNQSWCKNIAYRAGKFSKTSRPTTCNLFQGEPLAFDETAQVVFSNLRQSLLLTGLNVNFLNASFEEGKLKKAEFHLDCSLCSRTRYVYEPNYVLQEDMGKEMWFDAVNQTWYIVNEDWN